MPTTFAVHRMLHRALAFAAEDAHDDTDAVGKEDGGPSPANAGDVAGAHTGDIVGALNGDVAEAKSKPTMAISDTRDTSLPDSNIEGELGNSEAVSERGAVVDYVGDDVADDVLETVGRLREWPDYATK
jgi:hypothetical protein